MKVQDGSAGHLNRTSDKNVRGVESRSRISEHGELKRAVDGKDQASLSEAARLLAKARLALVERPELRDELIQSLQEKIQAGEYDVPFDELAAKLLEQLQAE